jgi:hypothetical protein
MRILCALIVCGICPELWSQGIDPIDNYLSSAQEKANNVVYNAGAAGRGVAMEAGQAALNAIGAFRAGYADSLKLTEGALKGQQAIFFRNIKSSMDVLNGDINGQTDKLQMTADTLASAISNLPFSSDIPRVTRVGPLYSVEETGLAKEVVIRGVGLSNGSPILEVGGKNISPNTKTDTEIRFPLPPHGSVTNKPLLFPATLHLFEKHKGIIWNDHVLRTYPIRLAIYPHEIGPFTVTPRRRVPKIDTNNVSTPSYRCESPHGEGGASAPVSVAPTPGWTIVVSSIKYNRSYSNNGSFTMGTTAATGFTATLTCSGFGIVKGPFGVVVNAGNQGVEQGTFSYTETREGTTLENGATKPAQALRWGDSLTISDLPADTETILFELKAFTGQTLDLEGGGSNRFMRLEYNAASKVATVTSLAIEQALRQ